MKLLQNLLAIWLITLLVLTSATVHAQELEAQVNINTLKLGGNSAQKQYYENMTRSISDFLNTRKWTTDQFATNERILCNINIVLSTRTASSTGDQFSGTMQISFSRPIYGSGYSSPILNINDGAVAFYYIDGQFLDFNESQFNPLTSLIGYYAMLIIGMDYDTYALNAGTPYYTRAEAVVRAVTPGENGWSQGQNALRNRFYLIQDLTDPRFAPKFRAAMYRYHRLGLDVMAQDAEKGRMEMFGALQDLYAANKDRPNTYLIQILLNSKSTEMVNAFSKLSASDRVKAVQMLGEMDPTNGPKYQQITRS